jgi:hypothetical protein
MGRRNLNPGVDCRQDRLYYGNARERTSFSDERDKFIELRALRNALYVFTGGFFLAMGSLALGMPPSVMFIVLMCSGYVSGLVGDGSQIYFYRKGS